MRRLRLGYRSEQVYLARTRRCIRANGERPPRDCGPAEIERLGTHLAAQRRCSASTQHPSLSAILLLHKAVLHVRMPWLEDFMRARRRQYLPLVLSESEVGKHCSSVTSASSGTLAGSAGAAGSMSARDVHPSRRSMGCVHSR
jgi:hypothetical protein